MRAISASNLWSLLAFFPRNCHRFYKTCAKENRGHCSALLLPLSAVFPVSELFVLWLNGSLGECPGNVKVSCSSEHPALEHIRNLQLTSNKSKFSNPLESFHSDRFHVYRLKSTEADDLRWFIEEPFRHVYIPITSACSVTSSSTWNKMSATNRTEWKNTKTVSKTCENDVNWVDTT